jgi:hypothetical protein
LNPALVKVREDIEEYQLLCVKYGEPVALKHGNPDVYGEHAKGLRRRLEDEAIAARQKAESEDWHKNMAIMMPMYDEDTGEILEDPAELEAAEKARRAERVKAQRAQKAVEKAAAVALEMKRQEAEKIRKVAERIKKAKARAAHRAANPPTRFKRKDPI